jgi:LAS superfamily LD-carboxypeptidase LdcB
MALSRRKAGRIIATLMALFLVPLLSVQGQAQNLPEGHDSPQEDPTVERESVLETLAISASSTDLGEVANAISQLEATIKTQLIRVTATNAELTTALRDGADLADEVASTKREVERLQISLADQAVLTFIGRETTNGLLMTGSPTVATRQDTLMSQVLGSQSDTLEAIEAQSKFLRAQKLRATQIQTEAEQLQVEAQHDLIALEQAQQALQEIRDELLIWHKAGRGRGTSVDARDIVDAGNGILVHKAISEDVSRLLVAAKTDGVVLGGGGYRDARGQIRVRKANCGSSNYAIYEMPARNCRPVTAKPGASMHEQGLAIDFSYNGVIIGSRSGPAWLWLAEHAGEYGLRNLPSEPWHFSTNGQ